MAPTGPYDSSIRKLAECADKTLEKNKDYTVSEAARLCRMDTRTVHGHVYSQLTELNLAMPPPKKVIRKQVCSCHDGLMVDPPASLEGNWDLPRGIGILGAGIMALDGLRRLSWRDEFGATELIFAGALGLLMISV